MCANTIREGCLVFIKIDFITELSIRSNEDIGIYLNTKKVSSVNIFLIQFDT